MYLKQVKAGYDFKTTNISPEKEKPNFVIDLSLNNLVRMSFSYGMPLSFIKSII